MLLPNASSLTWIEGGRRLLFSEIKEGLHMAVVTTDEGRGNSRDVYVPAGKRSMAHHSSLSPDGRWVLIVEMDSRSEIVPCRIVPFQGTSAIKIVGPANGACLSGAWSADGKWIYLTAKTDDFHIWRQRFPEGDPEQLHHVEDERKARSLPVADRKGALRGFNCSSIAGEIARGIEAAVYREGLSAFAVGRESAVGKLRHRHIHNDMARRPRKPGDSNDQRIVAH